MGHVAVASPRRMSIVVHDEPTSPTEHCGGRKGRRLNLCEVLDALGGFGELGQSDNRYVEVRGEVQGVERVEKAQTKLAADFLRGRVGLGLESPSQCNRACRYSGSCSCRYAALMISSSAVAQYGQR